MVRCLPDGRWFDESTQTWRDRRGRPARWPDLIDAAYFRLTRVVLAAAHLDKTPPTRLANLRSLTVRRRCWAIGDLFLGLHEMQMSLPLLSKPGFAQSVMIIRAAPRDSMRPRQTPMAARMQSPLARPLPLISMTGRRHNRQFRVGVMNRIQGPAVPGGWRGALELA
jgi:hypothetical protein